MKPTRKKIILTVLLAAVLVVAFIGIITQLNLALLSRERPSEEILVQDAIKHTLEEIDDSWKDAENLVQSKYKAAATLSAMALRPIVEKNGDEAIAEYPNGAIIKAEDETIMAPNRVDQRFGLTAEQFKKKQDLFSSPEAPDKLIVYSRIRQPYYYVEWYALDGFSEETELVADIPGILQKAEVTYDMYAFCAAESRDVDGENRILYQNEAFSALDETFQKMDLSDPAAFVPGKSSSFESGTIELSNGSFRYSSSPVPTVNGYLVLMKLQPNLYYMAFSHSVYMFSGLILFLAGLLVAGFTLYSFVQKNELSPSMEKRYQPCNIRRFACLCGIISAVCIFLSGMLIYSLNDLYDDTSKGKESLQRVSKSLSMYTERFQKNSELFKETYLEYGSRIAELLNDYPELREKSVLEILADSIRASSITLYDAAGKEITSSGDYIDLTLGRNAKESAYDFRRLLHGVPRIVHDRETDETTGESGIRIGLRLTDPDSPSRYNAMILSVDEALWNPDLHNLHQTVLANLSGTGTLHFIADGETGKILGASRENLIGSQITSLGFEEKDLMGGLIKTMDTEEGTFFITSAVLSSITDEKIDEGTANAIAYYAVRKTPSSGFWISALAGFLLFLVIYALLAYLVIGKYTDAYYEQNKRKLQAGASVKEGWKGIGHFFSSISPERAGIITMEVIVALYLNQLIPISNFKTPLERNSVFYYITSGNWEKGLNLFSLSAVLILLGEIVMSVILVRLLLSVCTTFVGGKAKTILRLIRSLIMYVALISFLIIACTYFGVSMTAIVAFVGTLGISISLGAQDFISDIIAGLTIVFEGTFHVGDIVDLNASSDHSYHGEVQEIGLRFTRLNTRGGNIVTISNRDIITVKNMTKSNSSYVCEFAISSEYPIEEIEELLARELPKIAQKDWRILAGPSYNGIVSLGNGTMILSIVTECNEHDVPYVQQLVNRSLQQIFTQNGYKI